MDGASDGDSKPDALVLKCFHIILRECIRTADLVKLSVALSDSSLVSKYQRKRFKDLLDKCEGQTASAFDYLLEAFNKNRDKFTFSNITKALDHEEFPADARVKRLLSYAIGGSSKDLLEIIENWNYLSRLDVTLRPKALEISSDECWVKTLILAAFDKIQKDKDKTLLDTIKNELLVLKQASQESLTVISAPESDKVAGADLKQDESNKVGKGSTEKSTDEAASIAAKNVRKDPHETLTSANDQTSDVNRRAKGNGDASDSNRTSSRNGDEKQRLMNEKISRNDDESTIYILPADNVEHFPDEKECLVEFRAVTSFSTPLPSGKSLHMVFEENMWKPIEMAFNERKSYYFLRILFNAKHTQRFQFKFCYKIDEGFRYECLPSYNELANRMISLKTVKENRSTINLTVCNFDKYHSNWMRSACDGMKKFLPETSQLIELKNFEGSADLLPDLLAWFDTMCRGWNIRNYDHDAKDKIKDTILPWLRNASLTVFADSKNRLQRIMLALYLCISFRKHEVEIRSSDMYKILLEMLAVHQLKKSDCEMVYEKCTSAFGYVQQTGHDLPAVREVMHWLYKKLERYSFNYWIFTLPLYWLFVHEGIKAEVVEEDCSQGPLLGRASLPSPNTIKWDSIRRGTEKRGTEFFEMADTIVKMTETHPWIAKTYLSILLATEVINLVLKRNDVAHIFPLDDMVMVYLRVEAKNFIKEKDDQCAIKEYFQARLDHAIDAALNSNKEGSDVKANVKCCLSIMNHINKFVKSQGRPSCSSRQLHWLIDAVLLKTIHWIGFLHMQQNDKCQLQKSFGDFLDNVTTGIYRREVTKKEIEFWCDLLNISWEIEELDKLWRQKILHEIENSIKNFATLKRKNEEFLEYFATTLDDIELHPDVERFFSEKAYAVTISLMQKANNEEKGLVQRFGKFFQSLSRPRIIPIFEKLFMREYMKVTSRSLSNQTRALFLVCNWTFSAQFFKIFGDDESLADFSSDSRKTIRKVKTSFQEVVQSIFNGHVIVEHLRIISKNIESFFSLYGMFDKSSPVDSTNNSRVADEISILADKIGILTSHLTIFEQTSNLVKNFVFVCNYVDYGDLPIPHAALDRKVKMDIRSRPIQDIVSIDELKNPCSAQFFGITESHLVEFEQIKFLKKSRKLFKRLFTNAIFHALPTHQEGLKLDDIMEIWASVKSNIFKLAASIDSGEILVSDVTNVFDILNGSKADIDFEVALLYGFYSFNTDMTAHLENMSERQLQIFNAFELQQTRLTMNTLLDLRQLLGLQGDFKKLLTQKNILDNQSTTNLAQVPAELKMSAVISITLNQIEVLQKFMAAERVIFWLRDKMEGLNEVKVMCDLAMISAGEDPVEVGRVSCLLSAAMGFAPLIFWNDEKNQTPGLRELLVHCKEVWKNVEKEEKILDDWEEADRQLNWFKDVEKFYGSVEKSSLTLAQEINENGNYIISKGKEVRKLCLENSISLTLLKDKDVESGSSKTLTLEALRELQSKLMLIAGDTENGQHDVNIFIEVLASVEKLAEVFVMLELSGCMLFSGWKAIIACKGDKDKSTNNLTIQIFFSDDSPPMIGQGNHIDLDRITGILKESLDKWEEHVASKRTEHYYLNEFNISQIMYLCREISTFEDNNEIPDQVKTLLSFVRQDFTQEDLRIALEDARKSYSNHDVESDTEESSQEEDNEDDGDDEDGTKRARRYWKAVKTLMSDDVAESQAKAAVIANDCDLTNSELWILENQHDAAMIEQFAEEFDETFGYLFNRTAEIVKTAFQQSSHNTLHEVLTRLQNDSAVSDTHEMTLQDSVNTICVGYLDETVMMDLQDHLSIDLLGSTLFNLSNYSPIHRSKLPGLRQGCLNLLISSEEEIFPTVISMYMKDADQPLPSRSEVLICTEQTTKDDVERFVRRALCTCPTKGKLAYTLAFADNLNYTNSVAFVEMYNNCLKCAHLDENFQLVLLLNKQQHYLATYFYKDMMDPKWTISNEDIHKYLARHLTADVTTKCAAQVIEEHAIVKVVSSKRSGVGKSLFVRRKRQALSNLGVDYRSVTIRLLENKIDLDYIIEKLCPSGKRIVNGETVLTHVDITPAVQNGIEAFVFNLFILGSIEGSDGKVWRSHRNHLYLVEITDLVNAGQKRFSNQHILKLLPGIRCHSPLKVLSLASKYPRDKYLGMDSEEFASEIFQRPYQYLFHYEQQHDLDDFTYSTPQGSETICIEVLLRHCCIDNPSWAQLRHFCSFLNFQLRNCEKSDFCNNPYIKPILAGLKLFAVRFMIKMAQDFATPSLIIADTSMKDFANDENGFETHQLRRKWEEASHPYVFFNEDGHTMTFINVKIDRQGNLLGRNDEILEKIITPELTTALHQQKFDLRKNFDDYSRGEKLRFLCQVLGIDHPFDPDPTYELTTDNVLKILAIYTRFKCGIPVIIMGETGCGKTRLVEFMSKLKAGRIPDQAEHRLENMTTIKIHGGITVNNIHTSVEKAILLERENSTDYAVLFCDEANTTEAIYAIKEVMCDRSIDGEYFSGSNLKIIAACNPYKRLSKEAIKKLEDSGLGYRFRTNKTTHLFGNIPVRSLVYRVVALPPSMQPFVWDFGQLNDEAEKIYIQQMTTKLSIKLSLADADNQRLCKVLSQCQRYMRTRTNECRYVSLRDIERCMTTFEWFFNKRSIIYPHMTEHLKEKHFETKLGEVIRTIILTVGVCYHASLDERKPFCEYLAQCLNIPALDAGRIEMEITACQLAFLLNIRVGNNIARNQALRENVFMMALCTDMKIPLFLVGKPGSSKSLAKTIIANNMQGQASRSKLYQKLKQIHMLSYQCSALTDAKGIEKVFNQCVQLQKNQNLATYTAVVVLDEIGLAEDSPNMPLKILHPLLERRSTDLTTVNQDDSEQVGFIGISNWALDPAKMNRGIFLTRDRPEEKDLRKTGKEIFQANRSLWHNNEDLFKELTKTYIKMYGKQTVEYFGLRDYYSLMKMICSRCKDEEVSFEEVVYAVSRNFGGGDREVIHSFLQEAQNCLEIEEDITIADMTIPIHLMIQDNLNEKESRFLLLLTNQFSIITLLESSIKIFSNGLQVVFGSSFPGDHSYTEICRNINKIKVCMETGKTVILLNMTNIHESLYDALNQHFVTMGKQNFVDLGLGGHRVKCRISKDFRLIVIEKRDVVYHEYPIPLINRLEKHHFSTEKLLGEQKKVLSSSLQCWAKDFQPPQSCFTCQHAFIGYHNDTPSSVIFTSQSNEMELFKETLLQSCSIDAIFRLRDSTLSEQEVEWIQNIYFKQQQHESLVDVLRKSILDNDRFCLMELTSFSGILWEKDRDELEKSLDLEKRSITLVPLEQFQTQQEYANRLDKFFRKCLKSIEQPRILLVQCAQAQLHGSLIACARYCLMNKIRNFCDQATNDGRNVTVCLLLSTERQSMNIDNPDSLILQHTSESMIIHIDEFRPSCEHISPVTNFYQKSLQQVFEAGQIELEIEGASCQPLVEIKALLIDCIPECMPMIRDHELKSDERKLKRLDILMNICSKDDNISQYFRKIILKRVVEAFSIVGDRFGEGMSWIVEQANNAKTLVNAGTFRRAIWLCLKHHMSRFLACIVSIIDQNSNLDILVKSEAAPWEINLWLGMLKDLEIHWTEMLKASHYVIKGRRIHESIELPFSFIIIEYLESQWKALGSQGDVTLERKFLGLFRHFKIRCVVTNAFMVEKSTFMKRFISDIVKICYNPGMDSIAEIELVSKVLFDFAVKEIRKWRENDDFKDGDEISVLFATYKELSPKLEIFAQILHRCPNVLQNHQKWISDQTLQDFCLHIFAFKDTLSLLKKNAENIRDPNACAEWIDLAREVKKLYSLIMNDAKDAAAMEGIDRDWEPLHLLDLFLLQLLPPSHNDSDLFKKFVKAIAPQAKLFWKGSITCDCRSIRFLRIVVKVLEKCSSNVKMQMLVNRNDANCNICHKLVKVPTFLPCQHFGCKDCVSRHLVTDDQDNLKCPVCVAQIPSGFVPTPKLLNQKDKATLVQMKQNCTSFFVEFLRQFCLKSENQGISAHRMEPQLKLLIKDIIVQDEENQQELDPAGFDMNINFKSVVLQLLLNYDKTFVEKEINHYLQSKDNSMKNSLFAVIIKTYVWKMFAKSGKFGDKVAITKHWQRNIQNSLRYLENHHDVMDLKVIEEVVGLRCALCQFGDLVKNCMDGVESSTVNGPVNVIVENFIQNCMETMKSASLVVKEFLLKYGAKKFGSQWLLMLTQHKVFKDLVPFHLLRAIRDRSTDFLTIVGRKYSEIKSFLQQNDFKGHNNEVGNIFDQNQDHLTCILAIISWMTEKGPDVHQNVSAMLRHRCGNLVEILDWVFHSNFLLWKVISSNSGSEHEALSLYQSCVITIAALVTSKSQLLNDFASILANPNSLVRMYLPTMPEHRFFSVLPELRTSNGQNAMYTCPKGHLYTIGDCTGAVTTANCPHCKETIGGLEYKLAVGNQRIDMNPITQTGYKRDAVDGNYCTGAERMSLQGHSVTQFILHTSLLAASFSEPGVISRELGFKDVDELHAFFVARLQQNMQDLAQSLAKNWDEATTILIRVVWRMLGQDHVNVAGNLSTLDNRRAWEDSFCNYYLRPVFQDIDNELEACQAVVSEADRLTSAPLTKLLQDVPSEDDEERNNCWENPNLWTVVEHKGIQHLSQVLQDAMDKSEGKVLRILLKSTSIRYLKHLQDVLTLQRKMVERYRFKLDLSDAENMTLRNHIERENVTDEEPLKRYCEAWNELSSHLKPIAPNFLVDHFDQLSLDSPLCMVLPSLRGKGQCAKLFAEFLIDIQNNFLSECMAVIKPLQQLKELDVQLLSVNDIVVLDKEKDLAQLIDMHSSYKITVDHENGRQHRTTYNFEALEKQVRERYVLCKKMIQKNTLPNIQYLQDVGIGAEWKELESTMQVPLSAKLCQDIDAAVEKSHSSDVCERIRTLTNAIRFLSMVKVDPEKSLHEFLEKDLKLPLSRSAVIPREVQLMHVLSLYNRLTWHKAVILVKQGHNPYKEALSLVTQEDIQEYLLYETRESFERVDVVKLQQTLNEMLITGTAIDDANWSLVEDVFPNLDGEDDAWFEKLPKDLCNKHITHLFKETVMHNADD